MQVNTSYNDTWSLDLNTNTWTQLSTTGGPPSPRTTSGGIYDSGRDLFIIFGGYDGSNKNDTWSLNLTDNTWSQVSTTGGPPSPRQLFGIAHDSANDRMIICGGVGTGTDDTWALNLNSYTWTTLQSPPNGFQKVGTAFDDKKEHMIMVGGEHGMPPETMALVFDAGSNTWPELKITGIVPPIRGNEIPSAVFNPLGQSTIMFGGGTSLSQTFDDTWELILFGGGSLIISPPPGNFVSTQSFDLVLIVEAEGLSVIGGNATFDDFDVTSYLLNCIIPGTLVSGGQTFRCPSLTGDFLGTGIHNFSVTLDLSDGSILSDTVRWEVKENTEP